MALLGTTQASSNPYLVLRSVFKKGSKMSANH